MKVSLPCTYSKTVSLGTVRLLRLHHVKLFDALNTHWTCPIDTLEFVLFWRVDMFVKVVCPDACHMLPMYVDLVCLCALSCEPADGL